jgi:hypothetical protein
MGQAWEMGAAELVAAYGRSRPAGADIATYLVTDLGFVATGVKGTSCTVKLRPSVVAASAVARAMNWLSAVNPSRVILSTLQQDWRHELSPGLDKALDQLDQIRQERASEPSRVYLSRPVPAGDLRLNADIATLLRGWSSLSWEERIAAAQRQLSGNLGDRYLMVEAEQATGCLRVIRLGDGVMPSCKEWRRTAIGRPIQDFPDPAFGQWLAESYRQVLARNMPAAQEVDAIVCIGAQPPVRLRYKRLLIPLQAADGRRLVLAGAAPDKTLNLRSA